MVVTHLAVLYLTMGLATVSLHISHYYGQMAGGNVAYKTFVSYNFFYWQYYMKSSQLDTYFLQF